MHNLTLHDHLALMVRESYDILFLLYLFIRNFINVAYFIDISTLMRTVMHNLCIGLINVYCYLLCFFKLLNSHSSAGVVTIPFNVIYCQLFQFSVC